jgi:hypothetical protein
MKPKRNIVFSVTSTRTFKSDDPSPGKETWDSDNTQYVLATDAEDAITRVREFWNRDDKGDGTIKRRTAFVFNGVSEIATIDIL